MAISGDGKHWSALPHSYLKASVCPPLFPHLLRLPRSFSSSFLALSLSCNDVLAT